MAPTHGINLAEKLFNQHTCYNVSSITYRSLGFYLCYFRKTHYRMNSIATNMPSYFLTDRIRMYRYPKYLQIFIISYCYPLSKIQVPITQRVALHKVAVIVRCSERHPVDALMEMKAVYELGVKAADDGLPVSDLPMASPISCV